MKVSSSHQSLSPIHPPTRNSGEIDDRHHAECQCKCSLTKLRHFCWVERGKIRRSIYANGGQWSCMMDQRGNDCRRRNQHPRVHAGDRDGETMAHLMTQGRICREMARRVTQCGHYPRTQHATRCILADPTPCLLLEPTSKLNGPLKRGPTHPNARRSRYARMARQTARVV